MQNLSAQVRANVASHWPVVANTGAQVSLHGSVLNGGMIEGVDENASNPFIGDVKSFYGSSLAAVQTNCQAMRFLLIWTMANDGFFIYDEYWFNYAHATDWWYDEYNNAGQGTGYLGQPLGAASQPIGGVYRRDFTNGISLSNTTGTAQTISLGGTFRKLRGTRAPSVNDGSLVASVTLAAKDRIILLRS